MTKLGGSRWSLNGLVDLVTGGTYEIGHAIVEELVELGAKVYTCSREETKLNECLQQWSAKDLQVDGCVCDLSSREQRVQLMEKVSLRFDGKLNILLVSRASFLRDLLEMNSENNFSQTAPLVFDGENYQL
ncbi:senescence-associated protein 13-like [Capsicum annuum]|uniref:senescence-associated protein 13-like n=1 Tax=Capsicum annuum TaxID=4072 RepID=UPI001FB05C7E|nr:senescence-associated protein 13-like [Capsicum annuum]